MDEIINKYYNQIKPIIKKIREYKCPNCSGNFNNSECNFCGSVDYNLEKELEKLKLLLDDFSKETITLNHHNIKINKLFNLLYTLNDSQDIINNFLDKYKYKQLFNEFSKETITKLDKTDIIFTDLELNTIETIIYQNNNQFNSSYIYKYFINRCINKQQNVNLECFQEIIKQLTEITLKPFYRNSQCILKEYEINKYGKHFVMYGSNRAHKIYLNINAIENMYYNQDSNMLITIFHESMHGIQHKNIFYDKQDIDPLVLLEIKDIILSKVIPNYYNENYNNISFEIEAEYFGQVLASNYINQNLIDNDIQYKYNNILNQQRTINGITTDIDTLFNNYIVDHPELLKKHYQLQYLYKIENNKVIPLTEEELYNQYEKIISNPNINEEQKKKYKLVFSQYININNYNKLKIQI